MKREFLWTVLVNGVSHQVGCRFAGDRYELYADGVFAGEILRKSLSTMWDGMEEPIRLFGVDCLFVVLDETPDLVVDGRMIGRNRIYEAVLRRKDNRVYLGYGILLGACLLLLITGLWLVFSGRIKQVGVYNAFIVLGAALTMGLWSAKHLWQLTRSQNSSIIGQDKLEGANSK